jgi:tetratricopeptide (TPR) repeat protein
MYRVAIPLLLALSFAVSPGHAQEGGDLQAQILYAFQAEDTNQLADLVQSLGTQVKAGGADAALRYHLAHAEYRFGLLLGERRARDAEAALSDCIDQLKQLLQQDAKSVEALALQAACDSDLARYKRLEARGLGMRADDRLREAYALAPRNPRVLYLIAVQGLARSKPGSEENQRAFAELQLAAQIFDQSSATSIDVPGWGHAETYLALGMQLQARGDLLGARNWLEKSLIVAPDYKAAQKQLASLVRH